MSIKIICYGGSYVAGLISKAEQETVLVAQPSANRLNLRMGKGFTEAIAGGAASLTPTAVTFVVVQYLVTSGYASMKSNPY